MLVTRFCIISLSKAIYKIHKWFGLMLSFKIFNKLKLLILVVIKIKFLLLLWIWIKDKLAMNME